MGVRPCMETPIWWCVNVIWVAGGHIWRDESWFPVSAWVKFAAVPTVTQVQPRATSRYIHTRRQICIYIYMYIYLHIFTYIYISPVGNEYPYLPQTLVLLIIHQLSG